MSKVEGHTESPSILVFPDDNESKTTADIEGQLAAKTIDIDGIDGMKVIEETKFDLPVDAQHRATRIKLFSVAKPHMRTFHMEWIAFFTAFLGWFAIPPLITEIKKSLGLTKNQVVTANAIGVSGTVFARLIMGTVCDKVGPRLGQGLLMVCCCLPVGLAGLVQNFGGFCAVRFFISLIGSTFVACQFHMSVMFAPAIVGTANAIVGGWGNMGGGVAQLLTPLVASGIEGTGVSANLAWRLTLIIPAGLVLLAGIGVLLFTQDLPDGSYKKLEASGMRQKENAKDVLRIGAVDIRSYILAGVYAACFGVELFVDNTFAEYFFEHFQMNKNTAGLAAASFGLMNIFSRATGGIFSDMCAKRWGMKGRLWFLWAIIVANGVFLIIFSRLEDFASAMVVVLFFSYFCQAGCGATFGVVPFVSRRALGVVSGIVGAGGNIGAFAMSWIPWGLSYQNSYLLVGCFVCFMSFSIFFLNFDGVTMFSRKLGPGTTEPMSTRNGHMFAHRTLDSEVAAAVHKDMIAELNSKADSKDKIIHDAELISAIGTPSGQGTDFIFTSRVKIGEQPAVLEAHVLESVDEPRTYKMASAYLNVPLAVADIPAESRLQLL